MKILTTAEAAKLLRTDIHTLQRQIQRGCYPPEVCGRVGRKYLFNEESLINFIFSSQIKLNTTI